MQSSVSHVEIPALLWRFIHTCDWSKARNLLESEGFEAVWPQTRERIVGRENYIKLNKDYPGSHRIEILDSNGYWDQSRQQTKVTTQVYIDSKMLDGSELKLFAVSLFEVSREGLITRAVEYWADCGEPPAWRRNLVEIY
jgi:hypothetical protein